MSLDCENIIFDIYSYYLNQNNINNKCEIAWDSIDIFSQEFESFHNNIVERLIWDISSIEVEASGNNYNEILCSWNKSLEEFNNCFLDCFKKPINLLISSNNNFNILANSLFDKKFEFEYRKNLGFLAEAIILKILYSHKPSLIKHIHRLPSFAKYDLYDACSKSFIDIKHTTKERYQYKKYYLEDREKIYNEFKKYPKLHCYKFLILETKIKKINSCIIEIEILPFISIQDLCKRQLGELKVA